jgi:hypothetical protein
MIFLEVVVALVREIVISLAAVQRYIQLVTLTMMMRVVPAVVLAALRFVMIIMVVNRFVRLVLVLGSVPLAAALSLAAV